MYVDNITSENMTLTNKGKAMQIKVYEQEIERLNNIINEFEEELKWQRKVSLSLNEAFAVSRIDTLINKLQKLKGSDK